jgi:hypothetical protein
VIIDGIGAYSGGFDAGGERRAANAPRWGYSGHPRDSKPRQILDFLRQRERYTPTIALLNPLFSTLNGAAVALIQKNPTQNNPDLVFFSDNTGAFSGARANQFGKSLPSAHRNPKLDHGSALSLLRQLRR